MPTWQTRLHLASSTSSNIAAGAGGQGVKRPNYQNGNSCEDPPLLSVPVLSATDSAVPSPSKHKPRHGRSHSNPFTTIFGNGRKTEKVVEAEVQDDTLDMCNGITNPSNSFPSKDFVMINGDRSRKEPTEMVIGKCGTCDNAMSWPKQVDCFRCQVCLMVNDLKLSTSPRGEVLATESPAKLPKKHPHLSLEKTRALIDECVHYYLQSRFGQNLSPKRNRLSLSGNKDGEQSRKLPLSVDQENVNGDMQASSQSIPSPLRVPPSLPNVVSSTKINTTTLNEAQQYTRSLPRLMFRPLENYLIACFTSFDCLNTSFSAYKPPQIHRAASEGTAMEAYPPLRSEECNIMKDPFAELDAKTLLLGDFAENGIWWTGKSQFDRQRHLGNTPRVPEGTLEDRVTTKTPRINWKEVHEWYNEILSVRRLCLDRLLELQREPPCIGSKTSSNFLALEKLEEVERDLTEACAHVQRTLLKACECILRRPGRPLRRPEDCRFLLILLANPLLYNSESSSLAHSHSLIPTRDTVETEKLSGLPASAVPHISCSPSQRSPSHKVGSAGKSSGIIKRILGLMANLSSECHYCLIHWFSKFTEPHFVNLVDLVGSFVSHRLRKHYGKKRANGHDPHGGLIPNISGPGAGTSAQLHAALGISGPPIAPEKGDALISYGDDWQVRASARVMSLLFSANFQAPDRPSEVQKGLAAENVEKRAESSMHSVCRRHRQLLPTSAFYNTLLDQSNLIADFEAWESRRGKFSFCQYPMFLSIWAKIRIMEHDVRRQMEIKAREAFFQSIKSRKAVSQYLVLKVRRDCLVEDSLRSVSEIVGAGQDEIKKGLRIDFIDEEGLDSGGLRKEWFLLLVREVFDPEHGLFVYDEESHYCYFNPNSFETSDQFFLVGVVLGLAIYNSTILDVALPPLAFRKLLASAPNYTGPATSSMRPMSSHTIEDLTEFRPSLGQGLKQLLEYEGNVEETFCCNFVVSVDRYGHLDQIPLCVNGENRPVTNSNRHEFVDLYIRYILDTSVARQYEPFKRGFYSVCEGNALSLFRPEEIELLIRGSDEPLDVATLRAVAIYDGWGRGVDPANEPVIIWFWESFSKASAKSQRKMLSFITSSDRIPAMGAMFLIIKFTCLGDHSNRFPIARTCFNMLGLYRYQSREVLEDKLWRAVIESEGFGMK